jgi:glycerol-3-phosphate acyltransferase PlsY
MLSWLIFLVIAYLLGAIPFALLLGRLGGVDIRTIGSGNVGATNLGRALGKSWGIAGFLLDVAKGAAPVAAFGLLGPDWPRGAVFPLLAWLLVGVMAIVGHMFPVYLGFKGGKGVATGLGVLLALWPVMTLAGVTAFILWLIITKATGYVSLGSMIGAASLPLTATGIALGMGRLAELPVYLALSLLLATLVIVRHRGNIRRLRAGTESKVAWAGRGQ